MILTWEARVVAEAADAAAGAAAATEINWNHNVTPDRDDLIMANRRLDPWNKFQWD